MGQTRTTAVRSPVKTREHSFTRDGITYDCLAFARRTRRQKLDEHRYWYVTVRGVEYAAMRFTGDEFTNRDNRLAFEDAIVSTVAKVIVRQL